MSEGLKLIAACIAEDKPGILIKLNQEVLVEGPETQAHEYVIQHYREFKTLPQAATIQEQTGVRIGTAREAAEYYESNCYNRYANTQAKQAFPRLREALEGTTTDDIAAALQAAQQITHALRYTQRDVRTYSMDRLMSRLESRILRRRMHGGDLTGIPSGWPEFDAITNGYQSSDLVFWVARTGIGKTFYLLWQVWAAMNAGYRVVVGTTEMSADQIGDRIASIALRIDPRRIHTGQISSYDLNRIRQLCTEFQNSGQLAVHELGFNSSLNELEAVCEDVQPDAIYIDGIYLLRSSIRGPMSRTEKVANVADELKTMAVRAKAPVICTSQFNRGAGKGGRDGSLETVGMSDAIVQNGSLVIRLTPGDSIDPENTREIEFLKGREGEFGRLRANYKFAPLDFSIIADEEPGYADRETVGT